MHNDEIMLQMSFDAWKFQVEAFWTRTSYFAAFELALAAGLWQIFNEKHWLSSVAMASAAAILTIIWMVNNSRLHEYVVYYYHRIEHFEKRLAIQEADSVFSHREQNPPPKAFPGQYHIYIETVPLLFLGGWGWMFCWAICELRHSLPYFI